MFADLKDDRPTLDRRELLKMAGAATAKTVREV